ncbi:MAG: NAD(P)/FAD-dependent oxidoreductase [Burkholderiaceae bacterium]
MTNTAHKASHVAIVGGGILGLSLALRLAKAGRRVTVFEAGKSVGGMAGSASYDAYTWDRFYHVVLLSDLKTRAFLEELGLSHRLRFGESRTGFFTDGELHGMTGALEFLRFKPLKWVDKARLAFTIAMAGQIRNPARLERITAVKWLTRWSGKRVVEKIWLPLLKSKLGANTPHASAAFIWAIIARLYAAKRSGIGQEKFGVIDGGYAIVMHALERRLEKLGVTVHTATPIREVRSTAEIAQVVLPNDQVQQFDEVIMTVAPTLAANLCPSLPAPDRQRMRSVKYQGVICAALMLRRPLSPYYVTNLTDGNLPFTGVIEMTALTGTEMFGGQSLIYLPLYLSQDAPEWAEPAQAIKNRFLKGLKQMHPTFDLADIVDIKISRVRHVMPLSTLNYSRDVMPPVKTSMPRVHFVNAAHIAYGTLNVNETLSLAEQHLTAFLGCTQRDFMPETSTISRADDAQVGAEAHTRAHVAQKPMSDANETATQADLAEKVI